jgi:hypothetical protein
MLKGIKGKFIFSYDGHLVVRKLYRKFNIKRGGKVNYSMNLRPGSKLRYQPEVIVTNYRKRQFINQIKFAYYTDKAAILLSPQTEDYRKKSFKSLLEGDSVKKK